MGLEQPDETSTAKKKCNPWSHFFVFFLVFKEGAGDRNDSADSTVTVTSSHRKSGGGKHPIMSITDPQQNQQKGPGLRHCLFLLFFS